MKSLRQDDDDQNQKSEKALTLQGMVLDGLDIVEAHKGYFLCNFVVPNRLSDGDGNWHVGAMATLMDTVGATASYFSAGDLKASLDFSVSYYSTAKVQEEVEIEAKVVGERERMSSVSIEIRKKGNAQLVATGKLWMASKNITLNPKL